MPEARGRLPSDRWRQTWRPLALSVRRLAWRCPTVPSAVAAGLLVALLTTACGLGPDQAAPAPSRPTDSPGSVQGEIAARLPGQRSESRPGLGANTTHPPLSVALAFADTPGLGRQVPLQVSLYSEFGVPAITLVVDELPPGIELVHGARRWEGCLGEEESKAFELVLGFPQEGTFRVGAMVVAELAGGTRHEQQHQLNIRVTEAGSTVSYR